MKSVQMNTAFCQDKCMIRDCPLFHGLSAETMGLLLEKKTCKEYKKKDILFSEGRQPRGIYFINKGKVKVYARGDDGKQQIVLLAKEGYLLGFRAMLSEGLFNVSAEILEDAFICFIPKSSFFEVLEKAPGMKAELLRKLSAELTEMATRLTNMAQKTVKIRLATTLLSLNDFYKKPYQAKAEINLLREDIANLVGTSTETVIRLLREFHDIGLIKIKGRKIWVLEVGELVKMGAQ